MVVESQIAVYIIVGAFQVASILGGGGLVAYRLGQTNQRQESTSSQTAFAIKEIKDEILALRALMTDVALQKQEINQLRIWYDELRRGEGFVFPIAARLGGSGTASRGSDAF